MNADGVACATIHEELADFLRGQGATVLVSAAEVDRLLGEREPRGLLVSQDLPGVSPERARGWIEPRRGRVGLWLEEEPPAAWRTLAAGVVHWRGALAEADLEAWLKALERRAQFGMGPGVHLWLDTSPGAIGWSRLLRWAEALAAQHGPGLMVDADWGVGALTETVLPRAWSGRTLNTETLWPWRLGKFLAAPPPWEVPPRAPERGQVEALVESAPWVLVTVGGDVRATPAARWLSAGHDLIWQAEGATSERLRQTLSLLTALAPSLEIGVIAGQQVAGAAWLPVTWPESPAEEQRPARAWLPRALMAFQRRGQPK
jgi:hypothetical protein